jgi:hypothetical protein
MPKRNAEEAELNPPSAYSQGPLNCATSDLEDFWRMAGQAAATMYLEDDGGYYYDSLPLIHGTPMPLAIAEAAAGAPPAKDA